MKAKLLKKLRKKFKVKKSVHGYYYVDGLVGIRDLSFSKLENVCKYRNTCIIEYARIRYASYSVFSKKHLIKPNILNIKPQPR
jgi:hypothetical protein